VFLSHSAMLGVACDSFVLLVVDTDTRRVVRTFHGHRNRVTDMVSWSWSSSQHSLSQSGS